MSLIPNPCLCAAARAGRGQLSAGRGRAAQVDPAPARVALLPAVARGHLGLRRLRPLALARAPLLALPGLWRWRGLQLPEVQRSLLVTGQGLNNDSQKVRDSKSPLMLSAAGDNLHNPHRIFGSSYQQRSLQNSDKATVQIRTMPMRAGLGTLLTKDLPAS